MVKGILSDNDVKGQVSHLVRILTSDDWKDLWLPLEISVFTFQDLGLPLAIADNILWKKCQEEDLVLITGNRNQESPTSLEATIRAFNADNCLPVFTIANPDKINQGKYFAEKAAARLLEYLMEIDNYRGTGRMYIP